MNYEPDTTAFPHEAYQVSGWSGVAFDVLGWRTEPDEDTEWTGMETRTGDIVAVMIGDDRHHRIDPDDLQPLDETDYCPECGQIGCGCYQ